MSSNPNLDLRILGLLQSLVLYSAMQKNDLRAGRMFLILINVANAMIVGFGLGRTFAFPFPHVAALLMLPPIALIVGVAFALYLAWRGEDPQKS